MNIVPSTTYRVTDAAAHASMWGGAKACPEGGHMAASYKNNSGRGGIQIICCEDPYTWILGKFARNMYDCLEKGGERCGLALYGDSQAKIGHHIIYLAAERKWTNIETLMITHVDTPQKTELLRRQLELYDMGICMSEATRNMLVAEGIPEESLCWINPAQDGVIRPRPLVLGIASKTHSDGRKNEQTIADVLARFPTDAFILKIMGAGWEKQVRTLLAGGYRVEHHAQFDYEVYTQSFMPSLDYFLYFSHDEGSMAFLDALAAGVKTIATPQGFHLDIKDAIDYPINDSADLASVLELILRERQERTDKVKNLTWDEYAWRHMVVWDYLLQKTMPELAAEQTVFARLLPKLLPTGHQDLAAKLRLPVPPEDALLTAAEAASRHGLNCLASCLLRQTLVFYPKNASVRDTVLGLYPAWTESIPMFAGQQATPAEKYKDQSTEYNVHDIQYNGTIVPLFYHHHNCGCKHDTRTTERTVELALADYWLNQYDNDVIELGAVTPYYFPGRIATVVDPADKHNLVSVRKSLFKYDIAKKNVLSISTIEHIGTKDYGAVSAHEDAVSALKYILTNSRNCLITFPFGYNTLLDTFIVKTDFGKQVCVTYIYRGRLYNDWKTTTCTNAIKNIPYGPKWANALVVIEKNANGYSALH